MVLLTSHADLHMEEGIYMQKVSMEGVDDLACTKPEAKIVTEQI